LWRNFNRDELGFEFLRVFECILDQASGYLMRAHPVERILRVVYADGEMMRHAKNLEGEPASTVTGSTRM
jgi:hypothetical protein